MLKLFYKCFFTLFIIRSGPPTSTPQPPPTTPTRASPPSQSQLPPETPQLDSYSRSQPILPPQTPQIESSPRSLSQFCDTLPPETHASNKYQRGLLQKIEIMFS